MYGMINGAIKEYLITRYGEATWHQILQESQAKEDSFLSMKYYPDELSVSLIVSAASGTGQTVEQMLQDVGFYWIEYALKTSYGGLLEAAGSSLKEVIENLDNLHTRLVSTFPELQPPSFWCKDVEVSRPGYSSALLLHYISERDGLTDFVTGLIKGLAQMCSVECHVEVLSSKANGADHDTFLVEYRPIAEH